MLTKLEVVPSAKIEHKVLGQHLALFIRKGNAWSKNVSGSAALILSFLVHGESDYAGLLGMVKVKDLNRLGRGQVCATPLLFLPH